MDFSHTAQYHTSLQIYLSVPNSRQHRRGHEGAYTERQKTPDPTSSHKHKQYNSSCRACLDHLTR